MPRRIRYAVDEATGERLDAEVLFSSHKSGFAVREDYHQRIFRPRCVECGQLLQLAHSTKDWVFFKHLPHSGDCLLKDGGITDEEVADIDRIHAAKESPRHQELKARIAAALNCTEHVSEVKTEKVFQRGLSRCRADVYCQFQKHQLVFEVQLSKLPLKYILNRHHFYRKQGIYLIWVLENFDLKIGIKSFARDIKYLAPHQNFFHATRDDSIFALDCEYKECFIATNGAIRSKWVQKRVSLTELTFFQETKQVYFYPYDTVLERLEREAKEKQEKAVVDAHQAEQEQYARHIQYSVTQGVRWMNVCKEQAYLSSWQVERFNEALAGEDAIEAFNAHLGLDGKHRERFLRLFFAEDRHSFQLLKFILENDRFRFDVQALHTEHTLIAQLLRKKVLYFKQLVCLLFRRGYQLTPGDRQALKDFSDEDDVERVWFVSFMAALPNTALCPAVFRRDRLLFAIASIKEGHLIGYGFKGNPMLQLAHWALGSKVKPQRIVIKALRYYGRLDELLKADKSGKLLRKLDDVEKLWPEDNLTDEERDVICCLFPGLLDGSVKRLF